MTKELISELTAESYSSGDERSTPIIELDKALAAVRNFAQRMPDRGGADRVGKAIADYLLFHNGLKLIDHDVEAIGEAAIAAMPVQQSVTDCNRLASSESPDVVTKLRKQLSAYQKAFNAVDDRMEYRGMSKEDFAGIAKRLTDDLRGESPDVAEYKMRGFPTPIEALKRLVSLKDHKDTHGKDAYYEFEQPIAWRLAKEVLASSEIRVNEGSRSTAPGTLDEAHPLPSPVMGDAGSELARTELASDNNGLSMPGGSNPRTSRAPTEDDNGNSWLSCARELKETSRAPAKAQPEERGAEKGTVAQETGASRAETEQPDCVNCDSFAAEIYEIIRVARDNPDGLREFLQLNFPKEWGLSKAEHRALLDAPAPATNFEHRRGEMFEVATQQPDDSTELAEGVLKLTETLRYIQGIVERGEGRKLANDECVDIAILNYVKKLEQRPADLESIQQEYYKRGFKEAQAMYSGPERESIESARLDGYINGIQAVTNKRPPASTTHDGANALNEIRAWGDELIANAVDALGQIRRKSPEEKP